MREEEKEFGAWERGRVGKFYRRVWVPDIKGGGAGQ